MTATAYPGAELIAARRREAGKSARQAALAAGISPTHWMDVERSRSPGSDEVLAKMASVLWITPDELESATGRPEAAAELRRLLNVTPADNTTADVRELVERIGSSRQLTGAQERILYDQIMNAIATVTAR